MTTATTEQITAELLTEEAAEAHEHAEDNLDDQRIRWRLDRQLMLLRMLPKGMHVERIQLSPRRVEFVVGRDGHLHACAYRQTMPAGQGQQVRWYNGSGGSTGGLAEAIAVGLAALDAEARGG
jgi:hypothetical protein